MTNASHEAQLSRAEFERFLSALNDQTIQWEKRPFLPGGQIIHKIEASEIRLQKHCFHNPPPAAIVEFKYLPEHVKLRWYVAPSHIRAFFKFILIAVWGTMALCYLPTVKLMMPVYAPVLFGLFYSGFFFLIMRGIEIWHATKSETICEMVSSTVADAISLRTGDAPRI